MTDGQNHNVQTESDQELETAAVAGAAAVQRLIADRNNLRNRLALHERELAASRAAQEDLHRGLGLWHQRYIELARRVVSELEQFDVAFREALSDRSEATAASRQFDINALRSGSQTPASNGINGSKPPLPLEP